MILLLFAVFLLLIIAGLPIAVAIGLSAFTVIFVSGDIQPMVMAQAFTRQVGSFSLVAIPFFMLAGSIMEKSGITQKLVNFADAVVGWITGGMAYVAIFA